MILLYSRLFRLSDIVPSSLLKRAFDTDIHSHINFFECDSSPKIKILSLKGGYKTVLQYWANGYKTADMVTQDSITRQSNGDIFHGRKDQHVLRNVSTTPETWGAFLLSIWKVSMLSTLIVLPQHSWIQYLCQSLMEAYWRLIALVFQNRPIHKLQFECHDKENGWQRPGKTHTLIPCTNIFLLLNHTSFWLLSTFL